MTLPPLNAIRVFEAAARHLSFTRAAEELAMTQAGVSYQIKLLEKRLGEQLFLRGPRGITLTSAGAALARPTGDAFDLLREAYQPRKTGTTLAISSFASFAANWLAPRLGKFHIAHPEIAVRLDSSNRPVEFNHEEFDLAIRYGDGDWPGLEAHALMPVGFSPMLAPSLAARHRLNEPADIVPLQWIDPEQADWPLWLAAAGVPNPNCQARPGLQLGSQVHHAQAAIAGAGVALLNPCFFSHELASGQLVQPFDIVAGNGKSYWLVYPSARRNRPSIRAFRQFLHDEIAAQNL